MSVGGMAEQRVREVGSRPSFACLDFASGREAMLGNLIV
jgi:nucleoside-triphosphatase THEP1